MEKYTSSYVHSVVNIKNIRWWNCGGEGLNRTPSGFDLSKCVVIFSFLEIIIHHYEPLGDCLLLWISLQSLIVSFVLDVMAAWYAGSDVMRLLSLLLLLLPLSSYLQCCWALHCSSSPYATQVCVILKQYRNILRRP